MKIIKEDLDNLERVENRQTVQGIMMKDAEEQSKKSEDNFKEVAGNPEDLKKKKPFISGEKQPKPKDVEIPKPELEESLFESVDDGLGDLDTKDPQYLLMLLSRMKSDCDYVLGSGGKGAIKYLWAGSVDGQIETMKYIYNLLVPKYVNDIEWISMEEIDRYDSMLSHLHESVRLHEAGGVKNGILYSTDGEPLTFWDKIYAELDGNLSNDNDYTKLIELPVKVKNKYQEISVTNDGNIRVFSPSEEGLQHALDVAEHYGLDYESGASTGYSDPAKAFYCTVIIPEERQEEFVTYDARKSRPVKKDNIKVA